MSKKTSKKASKKASKKESSTQATTKESKVESIVKLYNSDSVYCQIPVTNYKKTIKFYNEIVELEPSDFSKTVSDPAAIGWYEFKLPVKGSFLGLNHATSGSVTPSNSLVLSVNNLDKLFDTLKKKNANPSDIIDVPNMISFTTIKDPDQNSIMFVGEPRIKG